MTNKLNNWNQEGCTTVGQGDLILGGLISVSQVRFRDGLQPGDVYYSIVDGASREAGIGIFNGVDKIIRSDIHTTLYGGVFNDASPTPIPLTGDSIVSGTYNTHAFNEVNTAIADLSTRMTVVEEDIANLGGGSTGLDARVTTNETNIATNTTNIATNTTGIATVAGDLATLDADVAYREVSITALEQGGLITQNGPNSILVALGSGEIIDSYTDTENQGTEEISWTEQTLDLIAAGGMPLATGLGYTTIGAESSGLSDGTSVIKAYPNGVSSAQRKVVIVLGHVEYINRVLTDVNYSPVVSNQVGNLLMDLIDFVENGAKMKGLVVRPTALPTPSLSLWRDSGVIFGVGANYNNAKNDQNVVQVGADGAEDVAIDFELVSYNNGVTAVGANVILVPNDLYEPDGAGTISAVANGSTTIHYFMEATSGQQFVLYGQKEYGTHAEAVTNLFADRATHLFPIELGKAFLLAQLVVDKNVDVWGLTAEVFPIDSSTSSGSAGGSASQAVNISYNDTYNLGNNVQSALDTLAALKLTPDQHGAVNGANAPTAANPFVVESDLALVSIASFDTVASLKTSTHAIGAVVSTKGYFAIGDEGFTTYEIVAAATGVDDGGSFITLNNGNQAKAIWENDYVNFRQFGVKGDGTTDDTVQLQAIFDYTNSTQGHEGDTYLVTARLYITSGKHDFRDSILKRGFTQEAELPKDKALITITGSNITITDINYDPNAFWGRMLSVNDSTDVRLIRPKTIGGIGTFSIAMYDSFQIFVTDAHIINVGGLFCDGMHFFGCYEVSIVGGHFHTSDDCISFTEQGTGGGSQAGNITVTGVTLKSDTYAALKFKLDEAAQSSIENVTVDCVITSTNECWRAIYIENLHPTLKLKNLNVTAAIDAEFSSLSYEHVLIDNIDNITVDLSIVNGKSSSVLASNCNGLFGRVAILDNTFAGPLFDLKNGTDFDLAISAKNCPSGTVLKTGDGGAVTGGRITVFGSGVEQLVEMYNTSHLYVEQHTDGPSTVTSLSLEAATCSNNTFNNSDLTGVPFIPGMTILGSDSVVGAANTNVETGPTGDNLVINGDFSVWQRSMPAAGLTDAFTADRWHVHADDSTISRVASVANDGRGDSIKLVNGGSTTYCNLRTPIEWTADFKPNDTYTVTFEAKSPTSISLNCTVGVTNNIKSVQVLVPFLVSTNIALSSVSGVYTLKFTIPSDIPTTATMLAIGFGNATAGSEFEVYNVQVEKGNTSRPFQLVKPADQLARCQRYCQVYPQFTVIGSGYNANTTRVLLVISQQVAFRADPTFEGTPAFSIHTNGLVVNDVDLSIFDVQQLGAACQIKFDSTLAVSANYLSSCRAESDLVLSAEIF